MPNPPDNGGCWTTRRSVVSATSWYGRYALVLYDAADPQRRGEADEAELVRLAYVAPVSGPDSDHHTLGRGMSRLSLRRTADRLVLAVAAGRDRRKVSGHSPPPQHP